MRFSRFTEDFAEANLRQWTANYGAATTVAGGAARIPVDTGFNGLQTAKAHTLKGSSVHARVTAPAVGGAATTASITMSINSQTDGTSLNIGIDTKAAQITFQSQSGYFDPAAVTIPYSAATHAWVRLREYGGTLYFDTSPDAIAWTNRRTTATPGWLTSAQNHSLAFGAHRDSGTNDYATVTAINLTTPQLATRCVFGAYYSDGGADTLLIPTDGSAHHTWEVANSIVVPRIVYYADIDSPLPAGAAYYKNDGVHRVVRAWDPQYMSGGTMKLAKFSDILAGKWDTVLHDVLAAHAAWGPVDFRMWWESNLDTGYASPLYNGPMERACTSPQQYIDAWRYVVGYARSNFPAADMRFLWIPNGSDNNSALSMEMIFPGLDWVDAIGFDTYNDIQYDYWYYFRTKIEPVYRRVTFCASNYPGGYDKGRYQRWRASDLDVVIGETGTTTGPLPEHTVSNWMSSMYTSRAFPRLRAVDFFNVNKGGKDWRITTTPEALAVAQAYL